MKGLLELASDREPFVPGDHRGETANIVDFEPDAITLLQAALERDNLDPLRFFTLEPGEARMLTGLATG